MLNKGGVNMKSNNNGCYQSDCGCQQCDNGKFNCTGARPLRAIDMSCIPSIIPDQAEEGILAYGSFYDPSTNFVEVTPVTPPTLGQKVIFTTPGPSLGVYPAPVPNNTTDLQVATSGVYEMNMNILVELGNATYSPATNVRFGLFINDTIFASGSEFGSLNDISGDELLTLFMSNTIGNTIQLRLNKDDRLSIRVILATGLQNVYYRLPSLVVNKIAD